MFDEMQGRPDVQQLFFPLAGIDEVNEHCNDQ
jgi:hypothetical protein